MVQEECDGYDTKIAAVGPAAENGVLYGSLIFDYWDAAGRMGTGTVMASKNLKALAARGDGELSVAHPERYMDVITDGWLGVINDSGFKTMEHSALGTSVCVNWGNAQGWLVTRNFRDGEFEKADDISGEEFRDRLSTKEPPIPGGRACMSCPNRCKRFGVVKSGKYAGTKGNIEFEGVGAFGSKCGVGDLDAVFHAYMLSNDYGMDCISSGNMIATLMELYEDKKLKRKDAEGLDLRFGNVEAMIELIHRIANKKGRLGKLGAMGTDRALKALKADQKYFTAIKGSDTICCDPRAAKGFGFGYAVSSRGSDHLRAHAVFEMLRMPGDIGKRMFGSSESTRLGTYGGKVNLIIWHEDLGAVTDSLGTCRFMHASYYAQYPIPEMLAELKGKKDVNSIKYHDWLSAATGIEFDYEGLLKAGKRIINLERALNTRFGIRRKDDRLPRRFTTQPLKGGKADGEVYDPGIFEKMLDEYYQSRGWDKKSGLLKKRALDDLGLKDVSKKLSAEKLIASRTKRKKRG
jgi:aldehyde:ferredoxin oxidoreductase